MILKLLSVVHYPAVAVLRRALFPGEGSYTLSKVPVISIIDDDASVRIGANNLLRSHGYTVHTFASAEEFLRSGHRDSTSCVIADIQMPAMNGIELQRFLVAQGARVPFIFITAFPDESVRAQALKAGALCFLTKPFDGPTLIRCLDTALEKDSGQITG
jgi:FixJ family two-component response regulator